MKAQALVYEGPERLAMREFPIPSIGPDEMLVEVLLAGVDGSEIHMLRGEMQRINDLAPVIFGDEIVGRVAVLGELAAEHRGLAPGDEVIVEARWPCNSCRACVAGQYYLCERAGAGEGGYGYGWITCAEPPHLWGGYASHLFVPADALVHRVPEGMASETALVCGSVLANSYRWTGRGGVGLGTSVVIIGPGPQGIGCALASALRGATVTVIGLERDSARLAAAAEMGADRVLTLPEDGDVPTAAAAAGDLLGNEHVDVVIDAAGAEASKQLAMELVRPMGTIVSISVPAPAQIAIDWLQVLLKEVTMISPLSHPHSVEPALAMGSKLVERGLDPGRLVSHVFPLEESERALRTAAYEMEERPTKVAIRPRSR